MWLLKEEEDLHFDLSAIPLSISTPILKLEMTIFVIHKF